VTGVVQVPAHVVRQRITVTGAVQGVGFRPFAFRLAHELGLAGFVGNDAGGAFAEVEGPETAVAQFTDRLAREAPPLARIATVSAQPVAIRGERAFTIADSVASPGARTLVPPDTATCAACLAEVQDPTDRRHRHPFANCTDCGPRFTIIRDLPYDRPATTMAAFALCPACAAEYTDPGDRRHHAQPIACPQCGPQLWFAPAGTSAPTTRGTEAALAATHRAWSAGQVVAVKGIGGYHLTCDAGRDAAVLALRERKGRVDKPFAVMVRDLAHARALVTLDAAQEAALASPAAPIVLAQRRGAAAVSPHVAPGNPDLGVMLAPSALHRLLLSAVPGAGVDPPAVIVATSGNRSSEPICIDDAQAADRLGDIADAFLAHDRPIHVACDDSVIRVSGGHEQPIRRSRGYAPLPVALPVAVAPTLAVGGELKSTFCLAADRDGWLSQHIGDVENLETLEALERSVSAFTAMYRIAPEIVAVDRHPGYQSRRWGIEHAGAARIVEVQHHHAHVAALMAEHGRDGTAPMVGIVFDGTGFGEAVGGGPAIWGGEILVADYAGFRRAGHLAELPLPGGDGAVRNPCRLALAYLAACGVELDAGLAPVRAATTNERSVIARQVATGAGVVPATSMGRLFDVVAAVLGVRQRETFEAQAAIELQALAQTASDPAPLAFAVSGAGVIDPAPLLHELVRGLAAGADRASLALGFHRAVAQAAAAVAARAAQEAGVRTAGLTGGVFQNTLLSALCAAQLRDRGLEVLEHRTVPPNDGGLALGQAIIAGRGER
jgi:hydrogenase maturation protein HypF